MSAGPWGLAAPPAGVLSGGEAASEGRRSLLSGRVSVSDDRRADPPFSSVRTPRLRVDCTQAEARAERFKGFGATTHYLAFDVVAEVRDRVAPLAVEVVELLSSPPLFRDPLGAEVGQDGLALPGVAVVRLAGAVHELRIELVRALAGAGPSPEVRDRLARVVRDPAHERRPGIDNASLTSGGWVDLLAGHVEPLSGDLAAVVAGRPAGQVSALDVAISDALGGPDGFDQAVQFLERELPLLRRRQSSWRRGEREMAAAQARREREREAAALRKLGLR